MDKRKPSTKWTKVKSFVARSGEQVVVTLTKLKPNCYSRRRYEVFIRIGNRCNRPLLLWGTRKMTWKDIEEPFLFKMPEREVSGKMWSRSVWWAPVHYRLDVDYSCTGGLDEVPWFLTIESAMEWIGSYVSELVCGNLSGSFVEVL